MKKEGEDPRRPKQLGKTRPDWAELLRLKHRTGPPFYLVVQAPFEERPGLFRVLIQKTRPRNVVDVLWERRSVGGNGKETLPNSHQNVMAKSRLHI